MKEPVDHILRPRLPWRNDLPIVECGYNAESVKTITREQHFERKKEMGSQRSSLFTCMTCSQTVERWASWETDPRKALGREVEWESAWGQKRGERLKYELLAIADLIDKHKEEFEALVESKSTFSEKLTSWLEMKAKRAKTP